MDRNQLKGKQTPGTASIVLNDSYNAASVQDQDGMELGWFHPSAQFGKKPRRIEYADVKANAALYVEAHNAANETGMWPLDMVERIKELEDVLGTLLTDNYTLLCEAVHHKPTQYHGANDKCPVVEHARAILNKRL